MKVTVEESIKRKPHHPSEENRIMLTKNIKAIDELIASKLPKVVEIDTLKEQTVVWNDKERKIWEAN